MFSEYSEDMSEYTNLTKSEAWDMVCPWCSQGRVLVVDGRLAQHRYRPTREGECPASGSTPRHARDRADAALIFHACTGGHINYDGTEC